jgi:hypothetical protein
MFTLDTAAAYRRLFVVYVADSGYAYGGGCASATACRNYPCITGNVMLINEECEEVTSGSYRAAHVPDHYHSASEHEIIGRQIDTVVA